MWFVQALAEQADELWALHAHNSMVAAVQEQQSKDKAGDKKKKEKSDRHGPSLVPAWSPVSAMTNYLANISWWTRGPPTQCFFIGLRPQLLVQFSPVLLAGLLLPGGRWRYPFCLTSNILPGISCRQQSSFLSLEWISYSSRGCWWM
jgi:hypothetical protein